MTIRRWARLGVVGLTLAVLITAPGVQARQGPPPTPVPPNGSPSPFPQSLDTTKNDRVPPKLRAKAVVLADLTTGQILFAKAETKRRPIASLTKIMTGLLVLEDAGAGDKVKVSSAATRTSGIPGLSTLPLRAGERRTVSELLDALLIQSANDAAIALAEHIGGSVGGFIKDMNRRAKELGMSDTRFASPNGLNDAGYSSAADLAVLTQAAMSDPTFRTVVRKKLASIPPARSGERPRKIQNRNVLLWLYPGATGVKTGFTTRAGYCIVASAQRDGHELVAVVLGSPVPAYDDAAELLNYGFGGFRPTSVFAAGDVVDTRRIDGQQIDLLATEDLLAWVPRGKAPAPKVTVRLDAEAPDGAVSGVATVALGQREVGTLSVMGERPARTIPVGPAWSDLPPRIRAELAAAASAALLELIGSKAA